MGKKIMMIMLAIALVLITVFSASAQTTDISITSTPVTSAVLNNAYSYQVVATSESGITDFTYSLATAPTGMTINAGGLITWTPNALGTFAVEAKVAETANTSNYATQSFSVVVVDGVPRFEASDLNLGSDSQERDEQIISIPWTIKNSGSETISNIVVQNTVNSKYQFTVALPKTSLSPGESMNALISVYVPEDQDAGIKKIGQITVTGTASSGLTPLSRNVNLEVENNLIIDEIEVRVDGKKDTLSSPGTIDDEAELGDEIEIRVKIKNTYDSSDSDFEMRNIEMELQSSDLDDADGLDSTTSDLKGGRTDDDMIVTFTINARDVDPQDAPFDIDVIIRGEQRNGAEHGETWTIRLDMNVNSRDVRFLEVTAYPSTLTCSDSRIRIESEVRNVGSRDLEEIMIKYSIADLGISLWNRDISIDESDEDSVTDYLTIPSTAKPGNYLIELELYPQRTGSKTDSEVVSIVIPDCSEDNTGSTGTGGDTGSNNNNNVTPPGDVVVSGTPVTSATGSTGNFFGSNTYLVVLGVIVIILLVVVIVLAAKLAR